MLPPRRRVPLVARLKSQWGQRVDRGVLQDWAANAGNPKIQLTLLAFRAAQRIARAPRPLFLLGVPFLVLYRVIFEWLLGIELHWSLEVGPRLRIFHGYGLVVNPASRIGADCVLRHTTTLGLKETADEAPGGAPVLGDRVDVGPHVVILGPVKVGDGAVIGAGAVVTHDVPASATVVGNPARAIAKA
jgi:putative colanic acid biosynthesis acetyltransferase WcaB